MDIDGRQSRQNEISVTQNFTKNSALTFAYADADEQRNIMLGFTQGDLSLSAMAGSGEDYATLAGEYSGVDPYVFHAGFRQDFDVQGFAMDYRFGRLGHLQFGQANVSSSGLEDRRARYFEWSGSRLFVRATEFARGGAAIGKGVDMGYAFGKRRNKFVAVQAMQLDNDRNMQRIRFQFEGTQTRQYWFDVSAHQNALYKSNDDYRLMFNFKTLLGARSLASYQNDSGATEDAGAVGDEGGSSAKKKKGTAWKRAVFIGAGVGAAAALSSSGSTPQDNLSRFRSQNDAAFDVLDGINPQSIRENREYGGWVYLNIDGSYASTIPVRGEAASVTLPDTNLAIPSGGTATATYHTHAAFDPRFDNENFSPADLESDRAINVDGYLATPGGQFKFHDVSVGSVTTLGPISTE